MLQMYITAFDHKLSMVSETVIDLFQQISLQTPIPNNSLIVQLDSKTLPESPTRELHQNTSRGIFKNYLTSKLGGFSC